MGAQEQQLADRVNPQDIKKPDPSEPWRYVCPECQGQVNGDLTSTRYRCLSCEEFWDTNELYDQKLDRRGVS